MKIPSWASEVLQTMRPAPVWPNEHPDSTELMAWTAIKERFESQWWYLGADKWRTPSPKVFPSKAYTRDYISRAILRESINCWLEWKTVGQSGKEILDTLSDLNKVDERILEICAQLLNQFKIRDELISGGVLIDYPEDYSYVLGSRHAFNLLDALSITAGKTDLGGWSNSSKGRLFAAGIERDLLTESQYKTPGWTDLLESLAEYKKAQPRIEPPALRGLINSTKTNNTIISIQSRSLIGRLDNSYSFPTGCLLNCLTHNQLSALIELTFGIERSTIQADTTRKIVSRYRAENPLSDDSTF
ncbi:hypothetical protein ACWA7J_21680 [Leptothrix sp. BB-4]